MMEDRSSLKLPIMWGSDTLTTLMSMTAINAPNITATVISHLLTAGAAAAGAMGEAGWFIYSNIENMVLPPGCRL